MYVAGVCRIALIDIGADLPAAHPTVITCAYIRPWDFCTCGMSSTIIAGSVGALVHVRTHGAAAGPANVARTQKRPCSICTRGILITRCGADGTFVNIDTRCSLWVQSRACLANAHKMYHGATTGACAQGKPCCDPTGRHDTRLHCNASNGGAWKVHCDCARGTHTSHGERKSPRLWTAQGTRRQAPDLRYHVVLRCHVGLERPTRVVEERRGGARRRRTEKHATRRQRPGAESADIGCKTSTRHGS